MDSARLEGLLERIAIALERIAARAERGDRVPEEAGQAGQGAAEPGVATGEVEPKRAATLEAFLDKRGIRIKTVPPADPADAVIDSLSLFLGERYEALSGILAKIKRAMQAGLRITESLRGRPQQDVSSVCQFCTRLHELAFLEQYQYLRSPAYLIRAKTTTLPAAQRFFAGQWLERFILQKVRSVYGQIAAEVGGELPFEHLINPQIVLPNGDDFELDVLAAIGTRVYWIEAKSGDYQQHVDRYARFARRLGLDSDHCFMVLTDVASERCAALSSLFGMTVCNLHSFEERFLSVAREDTSPGDAFAPAAAEASPAE